MAGQSTSIPSSHNIHGSNSSVVGVHYKVGKKIGEGSFGVIFEGRGHTALSIDKKI